MDENCSGYVEKYGQEEAARKAEQEARKEAAAGIRKTDPRELGKLKVPEVPMVRQRWKEIRKRLL